MSKLLSEQEQKLSLYKIVASSDDLMTIKTTLDLSNLSTFAKEGILKSAIQYAIAHANNVIGEDEPLYGYQNEAREVTVDDYILIGRNDFRAEQRERNK